MTDVGQRVNSGGQWIHFSHGADIGVAGTGATREQAFEQAAVALTAVLTDPSAVAGRERVEIECAAPDDETLLVEWLNAIVFEMAVSGLIFGKFEVKLDGGKLRGVAWGEQVNVERHQPAVEVKGATYTECRVEQGANGLWRAQCVVDV
jgi:SHS2 domain-containing protein